MRPGRDGDGGTVTDALVEYSISTVPDRTDLPSSLREYYAHVDESDLESRRVEDLFGMAANHFEEARNWEPGTIAIAVLDPRVEVDGWGSEHTIVQIVTEDMPFLVDSVTMELSRLGVGIHFVVHPVMSCNVSGEPEFGSAAQLSDGRRLLSMMSVEIDRQADDEARQAIKDNLYRVLDDVRSAVRDWQPMRDRMMEVSASLDADRLPVDESEVAETAELLDWLADNHFLFLGARDYSLGVEDGEEVLRIVKGSGLGILAGDEHLGRPRRLAEMPPAAREQVKEPHLLNLTKAGTRSTVHRASYLDYVGVKTFDDDGVVTGERRFLGLFTSEVYNRSVTTLPRARRTVAEVLARTDYPPDGHDEKRLKTILERYPRDDLLQMDVDELYNVAVAIAGLQERRRVRVFSRRELFGRFVTVLVYLPRDRYNTSTRAGIEELLGYAVARVKLEGFPYEEMKRRSRSGRRSS